MRQTGPNCSQQIKEKDGEQPSHMMPTFPKFPKSELCINYGKINYFSSVFKKRKEMFWVFLKCSFKVREHFKR